jgi:hypothetical protein
MSSAGSRVRTGHRVALVLATGLRVGVCGPAASAAPTAVPSTAGGRPWELARLTAVLAVMPGLEGCSFTRVVDPGGGPASPSAPRCGRRTGSSVGDVAGYRAAPEAPVPGSDGCVLFGTGPAVNGTRKTTMRVDDRDRIVGTRVATRVGDTVDGLRGATVDVTIPPPIEPPR